MNTMNLKKVTSSRALNIEELDGNILLSCACNFKNVDSISSKKSRQNPLPSGSNHVSGKFKIFKKITLKN